MGFIKIMDTDNLSDSDYKKYRKSEINNRTGELVSNGFEYPSGSGNIFSLSEVAQSNLHGLKANSSVTPYPLPWATINDDGEYFITDEADALAFYGTAFTVVTTHRQGGNTLKRQINAANTRAEVEAIVDNR